MRLLRLAAVAAVLYAPCASAQSLYPRSVPSAFSGRLPIMPVAVTPGGVVSTNQTALAAFKSAYTVSNNAGCVSKSGNDGTAAVVSSGVPSSSCFASVQACLNSTAGTCYVGAGTFSELWHWRSDADSGSSGGTVAKAVISTTPGQTIFRNPGDSAAAATWTQSGTYPNLWYMSTTMSQAGVLRVVMNNLLDGWGVEQRLPIFGLNVYNKPWTSATSGAVTTALAAANAAGTGAVFDPNAGRLYVGLGGQNVATAAAAGAFRACWHDPYGNSTIFIYGTKLYVSGITFDCLSLNTQTAGTSGSPLPSALYASNVTTRFIGADGRTDNGFGIQGGFFLCESCTSIGSFDDDYHCDTDQFGARGLTVEINSIGLEAGDLQSFPANGTNSTPQASSSHGGCDTARFGGRYLGSTWENIADTSQASTAAYTWNVGIVVGMSGFAPYGGHQAGAMCSGATSGTRTCWNDFVQDVTPGPQSVASPWPNPYAVWGSGAGITMKQAWISGASTTIGGVVCDSSATCQTYDPASP